MSASNDDTLRQFCDVTGADESRSRFFLESSNWQLEVALSSFYEHGGHVEEATGNPPSNPMSVPLLSDSDMDSPPGSPLKVQKEKKNKKTTNQKFATLSSLQQDESSSDEEEVPNWNQHLVANKVSYENACSKIRQSNCAPVQQKITELTVEIERLKVELKDMEAKLEAKNHKLRTTIDKERRDQIDTGQAFYAGGSDRSGQQIIGPGKSKKDVVSEMFKSVRERGAVVFDDEPSTAGRGGGTFGGTGYRLGQTADDHEPVGASTTEQSQNEPRTVRLRLYREGFTVDAGALRHYADPENAEFLNCIRRGEVPEALRGGVGGGGGGVAGGSGAEVRVSLEDRRHEECPRALHKPSAFAGKGQMLGSPTPATVGATARVTETLDDRAANQRAAQLALQLDEALPVTNIQFRLADGSRLTGRFNHTHTVGHLREYVTTAAPTYQLQNFVLMTTFPSAELSDPAVTLQQANLLNSVVVQRLK